MGDVHDRASARPRRKRTRALTGIAASLAVSAASMIALAGPGTAAPITQAVPDASRLNALPLITDADLDLVDVPQDIRAPQIYNGAATPWADHKEMAQVLWNGNLACGATFLSDTWVLTAAHCVKGSFSGDTGGQPDAFYQVKPKDLSTSAVSVRSVSGTHAVDRIVSNPDYAEIYLFQSQRAHFMFGHHDMALLRLSSPATGVEHAELLTDKAGYASTPLMAYGWGDLDPGPENVYPGSGNLQATRPNLLFASADPFPTCDPGSPDFDAEPTIICVFAQGDLTGTGNGDSGGPWFVRGADGVDRQMGVTSFGRSTGYPTVDAPSGVASVPELAPWIHSVMSGADGGTGGGSLGSLDLFGSLTSGSSS